MTVSVSLLIWPALNKHCNYLITVRGQLGAAQVVTGARICRGHPDPDTGERGSDSSNADMLINTRNESTGIILCVLKICLGDENLRDIQHDDDNVSFLSHKPEGSECLK